MNDYLPDKLTEEELFKLTYHKGFMLIPEEFIGPCMSCGNGTIIKFCRKYNGYIGKCTTCNVNWKKS